MLKSEIISLSGMLSILFLYWEVFDLREISFNNISPVNVFFPFNISYNSFRIRTLSQMMLTMDFG